MASETKWTPKPVKCVAAEFKDDGLVAFEFRMDEPCISMGYANLFSAALDLYEALKRCRLLVKAASNLIEQNRLHEYMATWDEAECDGNCYIEDAAIAVNDADDALAKADGNAQEAKHG